MTYEEYAPQWNNATNTAFWSCVAICVVAVITFAYSIIGPITSFDQVFHPSSPIDVLEQMFWPVIAIILFLRLLSLAAYGSYFFALTQFTEAQVSWRDERPVRQVRSGVAMLALSLAIGIAVAAFGGASLSMIVVFICTWVCDIAAYFIIRDGFADMSQSERYDEEARRGAQLLRESASCNIRLMLTPLIAVGFIAFLAFFFLTFSRTSTPATNDDIYGRMAETAYSYSDTYSQIEETMKVFAALSGIICVIALVSMLVFGICAWIKSILGWSHLRKGGVTSPQAEEPSPLMPAEWEHYAVKNFWFVTTAHLIGYICVVFFTIHALPFIVTVVASAFNDSNPDNAIMGFTGALILMSLIVFGCNIGYAVSLSGFATVQPDDTAAESVRRVRTGIWILIAIFVLWWLGIYVTKFGGNTVLVYYLLLWVAAIVGYVYVIRGYGELMSHDGLNVNARRGARNLRYAAVCSLRLVVLPAVILFIIGYIVLSSAGYAYHTANGMGDGINGFAALSRLGSSISDIITFIQTGGKLIVIVTFVALVLAIWWSIPAFFYPIIGWGRLRSGHAIEPTDEENQTVEAVIPVVNEVPVTEDTATDDVQVVVDVPETTVTQEDSCQDSEDSYQDNEDSYQDNEDSIQQRLSDWYNDHKTWVIGGIAAIIILIIGILFFGSREDKLCGKSTSDLFYDVEDVIEVVENGNPLYTEPDENSSYVMEEVKGIEPQRVELYQYSAYAVIDEKDNWYKVVAFYNGGHVGYIQKSHCRKVVTGHISKNDTHHEWSILSDECGGTATIDRVQGTKNIYIKYQTVECDADDLSLGVWQDGKYVFCYTIPVGSLEYDENTTGLTLVQDAESPLYVGHYGRDMVHTVHHEWGDSEELDWSRVTKEQVEAIFGQVIATNNRCCYIITENGMKASDDTDDSSQTTMGHVTLFGDAGGFPIRLELDFSPSGNVSGTYYNIRYEATMPLEGFYDDGSLRLEGSVGGDTFTFTLSHHNDLHFTGFFDNTSGSTHLATTLSPE